MFLATPLVVGAASALLARFDMRLAEAALTLGASRLSTFCRVTLPVIAPGVAAGAVEGLAIPRRD